MEQENPMTGSQFQQLMEEVHGIRLLTAFCYVATFLCLCAIIVKRK